MEDGRITEEEAAILDNITGNLVEYVMALDKAWEDGIITSEEKSFLKKAREKIWDDAYDVVIKDNVISMDEERLMHALIKIVRHLEEMEM